MWATILVMASTSSLVGLVRSIDFNDALNSRFLDQTFYIVESTKNGCHYKAARASVKFYETAFPVVDSTPSIPSSSIRAGGDSSRAPRAAISTNFECRGRWTPLLCLLSTSDCNTDLRPRTENHLQTIWCSVISPPRIRIKPPLHPRSYLQNLGDSNGGSPSGSFPMPTVGVEGPP